MNLNSKLFTYLESEGKVKARQTFQTSEAICLMIYRVAQKERMFLKWLVVGRVKVGDLPKIYVRKLRTVDDLKVSIREEIATVPQEMLVNVMQNFEERIRTCVRQEGRHLSNIIFRN